MEVNKMTNKLISLSERVDQILTADRICDRGQMLEEIGLYNKFLKEPLTLGMFVPCDDEGDFLEEPKRINYKDIDGYYDEKAWKENNKDYQKAKEKVLFEGFKLRYSNVVYSKDWEINLYTLDCYQYLDEGVMNFKIDGNSIENIANKIGYLELTDYGVICAGMKQ